MRLYENVFILLPDLPDEERTQAIDHYKTVLVDNGAEMLRIDEWGRRKMAYEINNQTKGYYVLFEFVSTNDPIVEMERQMRLDDKIIRFLTIKKEEDFDREAYDAVRAAEEKPAEEAAPAAEEKPAEEAAPAAEEKPAEEAAPAAEEKPAEEAAPAAEEAPAKEESEA